MRMECKVRKKDAQYFNKKHLTKRCGFSDETKNGTVIMQPTVECWIVGLTQQEGETGLNLESKGNFEIYDT